MTLLSPRRVVHLELTRPLVTLRGLGDGRGVYTVFWVGEIPLGHEYFDAAELPIYSRDLEVIASESVAAATARYLFPDLISERAGAGGSGSFSAEAYDAVAATTAPLRRLQALRNEAEPGPSVSVVVISHGNEDGLERCLRSVHESRVAPQEVVVVDMGAYGTAPPSLPETTGEVLALTDDRSTVHPLWVGAISASFRDEDVMAVIGLVLPAELETEAQVAFERLLGGLGLGFEPTAYSRRHTIDGSGDFLLPLEKLHTPANFAVRSTWLRHVHLDGPSERHPALAPMTYLKLWYELLASGREGRYDPTAVVFRRHPGDESEVRAEASRQLSELVAFFATEFADGHDFADLHSGVLSVPSRLLPGAIRTMAFGSTIERRVVSARLAGYASGVQAFRPAAAARLRSTLRPRIPNHTA